ncbi:hypothetical protein OEZ85_003856 [Tetradesmus obliquus]|uniref:Tyrosine-protein kinase ephrin type A/B receptor-like domain-containing protein n=1 Tax=Tetradesmus obliquus TaxID=3088 RepID=A0ABY8UD41_TETOB|nr:hypothetical protein OEZ85_003856 [Tetradesmus obliquus]
MPTIVKVLQQAGVGYAESETKASLSSAVVKDGSTVQGSLCAAGQQAYEPSGPCYACPPWQYNPVAGGKCLNCSIPNTESTPTRTGCSCLTGYKEARTAAGLLEKCVLANLTCPPGTDYDAQGTACVSIASPTAEQAVDDNFTVVAGRWAVLDVLKNDKTVGGGLIELAPGLNAGQVTVAGGRIRYLPRAGSLGISSFNYTYVAKSGARSTAMVTVNITAGSCSPNMCGLNRATGDCDAATGRCNCPVGSRLEATFWVNPSVSARNLTPEVPACSYQFTPTGTFKLLGMTAQIGQPVNVGFKLAKPGTVRAAAAACITLDAAAPLVGVGNYPNCPVSSSTTIIHPSAVVKPQLINLARPTCIDGEYSVTVKVPNNFKSKKCFNIGVRLADGTTKRSVIALKAAAQP